MTAMTAHQMLRVMLDDLWRIDMAARGGSTDADFRTFAARVTNPYRHIDLAEILNGKETE